MRVLDDGTIIRSEEGNDHYDPHPTKARTALYWMFSLFGALAVAGIAAGEVFPALFGDGVDNFFGELLLAAGPLVVGGSVLVAVILYNVKKARAKRYGFGPLMKSGLYALLGAGCGLLLMLALTLVAAFIGQILIGIVVLVVLLGLLSR